jgi:hypothetical protein
MKMSLKMNWMKMKNYFYFSFYVFVCYCVRICGGLSNEIFSFSSLGNGIFYLLNGNDDVCFCLDFFV